MGAGVARKLFNNLIEAAAQSSVEDDDLPPRPVVVREMPRTGRIMSTSRLSDGLMDLQANTIRDLDPSSIVQTGLRDRIDVDSDGIRELAQSIREHGQHVPVLVRPLPDQIDRYEIVYGRRRLAAVRLIGGDMTIKAIVRGMRDEDAVIAQGHENNLRLDPSHIEKALFTAELRRKRFPNEIIMEALNVDRFAISKLVKIAEDIPHELIEMIGPAHEIGRRPWRDFGDLVISEKVDVIAVAEDALARLGHEASSSERFRYVHEALRRAIDAASRRNAAAQKLVHGPTRRLVGEKGPGPALEFRAGRKALSLSFRTSDNPEFGSWLERNIDTVVADLQERWMRESRRED